MEKHGFIYIWYDCKRKMYYIGSHYGTEDDGYICSSNRMRDAYRRRSHDFKRRIIKNKIDRSNLLEEEHKWLQLIPDDELGKKYYNLRKHKWGHWSTDEKTKLSIKEKIIKKLSDPEIRKKISESNKGKKLTEETINKIKEKRKYQIITEETKKKISESHKGINNFFYGRKHTEETKRKMSAAKKGKKGRKHNNETKRKMSESAKKRMKTEEGKMQMLNASIKALEIKKKII